MVEMIRMLKCAKDSATGSRTRAINQFKAIIVAAPTSLRHRLRDGLSLRNQLARARRFTDNHPDLVEQQTRFALR